MSETEDLEVADIITIVLYFAIVMAVGIFVSQLSLNCGVMAVTWKPCSLCNYTVLFSGDNQGQQGHRQWLLFGRKIHDVASG